MPTFILTHGVVGENTHVGNQYLIVSGLSSKTSAMLHGGVKLAFNENDAKYKLDLMTDILKEAGLDPQNLSDVLSDEVVQDLNLDVFDCIGEGGIHTTANGEVTDVEWEEIVPAIDEYNTQQYQVHTVEEVQDVPAAYRVIAERLLKDVVDEVVFL